MYLRASLLFNRLIFFNTLKMNHNWENLAVFIFNYKRIGENEKWKCVKKNMNNQYKNISFLLKAIMFLIQSSKTVSFVTKKKHNEISK